VGRNAVLFIDDLVLAGSEEKIAQTGDSEQSDMSDVLEETLATFRASTPGEDIELLVTMQPPHFARLAAEMPEVARQFQVIWLNDATTIERRDYILPTAALFGLEFETESGLQKLENERGVTFGEIFNFFWVLSRKGIRRVTCKEIESLIAERGRIWRREIYPQLDTYQQKTIDVVSDFLRFGLGTPLSAIVEACVAGHSGWAWLARRRYARALRRLAEQQWLRIGKGRVLGEESLLVPECSVTEELKRVRALADTVLQIGLRIPLSDRVWVTTDLSLALYSHRLFEICVEVNDSLIMLPATSFVAGWDRALLYARQARAYEARGKQFWGAAASLYEQAISLNSGNHFIEHSLASLYRRTGRTEEARKLLSSIVVQTPNDLTAYVTLLQIEYEGQNLRSAFAAYARIRRLLRRSVGSERSRAIASITCANFSSWYGQFLREQGDQARAYRRLLKTDRTYRVLLASFPSENRDELSVLLNGYGCLLYDELGRAEEAILKFKAALKANPNHTYSLHKLATVYLDQAKQHPEDRRKYLEAAEHFLRALLKLEPGHRPGKLHLARAQAEAVDWEGLEEGQVWAKASRIHRAFRESLEPAQHSG